MSAAALTNTLAQPQEDPQIVFEDLNMINQLREILKVAVCNRCKIEVSYDVPGLPLLYMLFMTQPMVADLPTCMVLHPLPKR